MNALPTLPYLGHRPVTVKYGSCAAAAASPVLQQPQPGKCRTIAHPSSVAFCLLIVLLVLLLYFPVFLSCPVPSLYPIELPTLPSFHSSPSLPPLHFPSSYPRKASFSSSIQTTRCLLLFHPVILPPPALFWLRGSIPTLRPGHARHCVSSSNSCLLIPAYPTTPLTYGVSRQLCRAP